MNVDAKDAGRGGLGGAIRLGGLKRRDIENCQDRSDAFDWARPVAAGCPLACTPGSDALE